MTDVLLGRAAAAPAADRFLHRPMAALLPCQDRGAADLFFSERPADLERAKALCAGCPLRTECLAGALERREPWGVWGGAIFQAGTVIAVKRPRGRPPKNPG